MMVSEIFSLCLYCNVSYEEFEVMNVGGKVLFLKEALQKRCGAKMSDVEDGFRKKMIVRDLWVSNFTKSKGIHTPLKTILAITGLQEGTVRGYLNEFRKLEKEEAAEALGNDGHKIITMAEYEEYIRLKKEMQELEEMLEKFMKYYGLENII